MSNEVDIRVNGYICRHPSILSLARQVGSDQSIESIIKAKAREKLHEADTILRSIDDTWKPPPFNPILIAQTLGIRCKAVKASGLDDAMLFVQNGMPTILYHEGRTNARTRFNIFHEIAHTLFPDYHHQVQYRGGKRKMFDPDGQLEYLCDIAAAEFMMPMDLFQADLVRRGFGAGQVRYLARRYGASIEAVSLRMVESDVQSCAIGLFKKWRTRRRRNQKHLAFLPETRTSYKPITSEQHMRAEYIMSSDHFRASGLFLQKHLSIGTTSCIQEAANTGQLTTAEEFIEIGRGRTKPFYVEALPMRTNSQSGKVLAFLYPM